ncbi:MAG: CopD family protein [Sediminibacterium sp.]|nr:CopD family protein [Sediminibacterium sp.]
MYPYLKALHIVFIVTWFAGLFYMPRLVIYIIEANEKATAEKKVLQDQLKIMLKRLWLGITWPSAIITLIFGIVVTIIGGWHKIIFEKEGLWFLLKLILVVLLYGYHFSLQFLYKKSMKGLYPYTAQQVRYWNEVPTVLLIAIVLLVVVKQLISFFWALIGIFVLLLVLFTAVGIYKKFRAKSNN